MQRTFIALGCALALAGGTALAQQQGSTDTQAGNSGPTFTEKVKGTAKEVGQKTKEAAKEVGQKTKEVAKDVGHKTKEVAVKVKDKTVEAGRDVRDVAKGDKQASTVGAGKDKQ